MSFFGEKRDLIQGFFLGQSLKTTQREQQKPTGKTSDRNRDFEIGIACGLASRGRRYRDAANKRYGNNCPLWEWGPWSNGKETRTFAGVDDYSAYLAATRNEFVSLDGAIDVTPQGAMEVTKVYEPDLFDFQFTATGPCAFRVDSSLKPGVSPSAGFHKWICEIKTPPVELGPGRYQFHVTDDAWASTYALFWWTEYQRVDVVGDDYDVDQWGPDDTFDLCQPTSVQFRIALMNSTGKGPSSGGIHGAFTIVKTHDFLWKERDRVRPWQCLGYRNRHCYSIQPEYGIRLRMVSDLFQLGPITRIDRSGTIGEQNNKLYGTGGYVLLPSTMVQKPVKSWVAEPYGIYFTCEDGMFINLYFQRTERSESQDYSAQWYFHLYTANKYGGFIRDEIVYYYTDGIPHFEVTSSQEGT